MSDEQMSAREAYEVVRSAVLTIQHTPYSPDRLRAVIVAEGEYRALARALPALRECVERDERERERRFAPVAFSSPELRAENTRLREQLAEAEGRNVLMVDDWIRDVIRTRTPVMHLPDPDDGTLKARADALAEAVERLPWGEGQDNDRLRFRGSNDCPAGLFYTPEFGRLLLALRAYRDKGGSDE